MLKSPMHSIDLLPFRPRNDRAADIARNRQRVGKEKLSAYAITGFGLSPFAVWMDGDKFFRLRPRPRAGGLGKRRARRCLRRKTRRSASSPLSFTTTSFAIVPPPGPVVFKNVKLYDADARTFRDG